MIVSNEIIHPYAYVGIRGESQVPASTLSESAKFKRAEKLREAVLKYYNVTLEEFLHKGRKDGNVLARQAFCYLCHHMCRLRQVDVAPLINRDRTTYIHALEQINGYLKVKDPRFTVEDIENIKRLM